MRDRDGDRFHRQQSPLALLVRIILSSSRPGDTVFDPCAGTGTTLVAAQQLDRKSVGIEKDIMNVECARTRIGALRDEDDISKFYSDYRFTENLADIWGSDVRVVKPAGLFETLELGIK